MIKIPCGACGGTGFAGELLTEEEARRPEQPVRLSLSDLCDPYRAAPEPIGAVLLDRVETKKLLAAFALSPLPPWRRPRAKMPDDHRERWVWLWCGFDGGPYEPTFLDATADAAGVSAQTAYALWPQILASRLLYPDGTISQVARDLLSAHIKNTTAPPRGPGRPMKG